MLHRWSLRGALGALGLALVLSAVIPSGEADASSSARAAPLAGSVQVRPDPAPAVASFSVDERRGRDAVLRHVRWDEQSRWRSLIGDARVDAAGLRLRTGPGTGNAVLGLLYSGDRVFVDTEFAPRDWRGDWVGVHVASSVSGLPYWQHGYVHRSYLRK